MKSRSFSERRVEITRERRDWHRGRSVASTSLQTASSPADRFRNKGVSFCELQVHPDSSAMSDDYAGSPINMYKRERHDTSSSVNANLYVSKVEDTRTMHNGWLERERRQIFDRWIAIDKRKRHFFSKWKREKNRAKLYAFDRIREQIVSNFVCNAIYVWLNW